MPVLGYELLGEAMKARLGLGVVPRGNAIAMSCWVR